MTGLDWVIVALTALMAVYGYAQGFLVGAMSLFGFAAGAFLGTRLGPLLLPDGAESPYAPIFGLVGALFAGAVLATGLEGLALALRRRVRAPGAGHPRRGARGGAHRVRRARHRLDRRRRRPPQLA